MADRIGIDRLVERGNAWYPLKVGNVFHNALNERVIEVWRKSDEEIEHSFEYGRQVMFFEADSRTGKIRSRLHGRVSYVDGERMVVSISGGFDLAAAAATHEIGVMLSFDETTYRAMFDALDRTSSATGRLCELRDLIYSDRTPEEREIYPVSLPYLNDAQQRGVNKVLAAKDVAIVHGPPGTGKTTTLVEAIFETLRRESQVLVCAQSNSAVDLICERLTDRGISVLRIGNPSRVNDKMLSSTYERRFEAHPDYPTLWKIRKSMREMRLTSKRGEQWHRRMDSLRRDSVELEARINADVLSDARVIASTLVGSEHRLLDSVNVSTLFIDEAAQALEAASWIPIRRAKRVIFAGDHCQLPPTVKCYEAQKQGLAVSLMERIARSHPGCVTMLSTQYRMHEDIMRFSNNWFYGSTMKAAPEVRNRGILDLDLAVEWIDTECVDTTPDTEAENDEKAFREALAGAGNGRLNVDEALLTLSTLAGYMAKIGEERILEERINFAVISPYRAQVRYLRKIISRTPSFQPFKSLITVNTVDGFQGRECDVVVISLVRSNDEGNIGFLRDLRRMNVAMTRARMKLIMIGNSATLGRYKFYRRLFEYACSLRQKMKDEEDTCLI